jgi:uncharacterized protein YukE
VARREFPALGFDPTPGDAGAVAAAAGDVDGAARLLAAAAGTVSRLDSSGWTGEAADAFRGQLKDLPRDLDLAARAHRTTARTLADYSGGLRTRQRRADELEARAAELERRQQAAIGEVNRLAAQRAPEGSPELADLRSRYGSARSRAAGLGSDLEAVIAAARRLHGEHRDAASSAARTIRDVADAPYQEPGWLSRAWGSVTSWISEHADVLQQISSVLKGVSAVLGVLSLVPGLQFLAPFAVAAVGIALALDVAVKLATGKGSWAAIGIDAALTFVPGGKILSGLKGARAVRAATAVDDLARAPGLAMRGNPLRGLGSTAVHSGNAGNSVVRRLFPELAGTNPLFRRTGLTSRFAGAGGPGFRNNCQSCVVAVDHQLAGTPTSAIRRLLNTPHDVMASPAWRQNIARATGTSHAFRSVGSYDDIARELHNAGDGARGIVHGMRTGAGGVPRAGHVFNVVNRNGRVFFLDGQTGKLARLEDFTGGLEFLRTH